MSADGVRVRLAIPEDDAALLALDAVSWPPGTGFPSLRLHRRSSFFNEQHVPESYLVAVSEGELVGYVRILRASPILEAAHVFGIFGLAVAEHARGRGVATALLQAAERYVRARGGGKLRLHVLATNQRAQQVYLRNGYVVEGRLAGEFRIDGEYVDDIIMAKRL